MNRDSLPFRQNCEGYFVTNSGLILAKDTKKGYLVFPGGGVDSGETFEEAILRETFEETGAILKDSVKTLGKITFLWDKSWIKSDKQRKRFNSFKGEEIRFFTGVVSEFKNLGSETHEDYWEGEKLMKISDVISFIESQRPFADNISVYREAQLKYLKKL